jgi:hypothetical protein
LALSSDLFDLSLPLLRGTKSDFLDFLGEAIPTLRDKMPTCQNLQRQLFREILYDSTPKQLASSNFLEEQVAVSHQSQFKRRTA